MRSKGLVTALAIVAASLLGLAPGGSAATAPSARQRVTDGEIKIGLHMPMTGAAPLPASSAERASDVYWRWLRQRDVKINGRFVRSVIKNDNYNPSQAVAVCKEMVEDNHVFLLAGTIQATGSDQIQACARYAESVGVPYVSLGSSKTGLKGLSRYFSLSASWPRQSKMLADYLVSDKGARRKKNGLLRYGTPNFEDAHDTFKRALEKRGAELNYDRTIPKVSGVAEANTVVAEMKAAGIDNVFVLVNPIFFLQLMAAANDRNYDPLWTGIGITLTFDSVTETGCRNGMSLDGARFLSPVPAYKNRDAFDPRHDRAMRRIYDDGGDSVTWLGWSGSVAIRKLLEKAGRDLSRRSFIEKTERLRHVVTGILPSFGFTRRDHFGGKATHVLKAVCRDRQWVTVRRFVTDF